MVYIFDNPVECPIVGCSEKFTNAGAMGKHFSYKHGIKDKEFRNFIVNLVKQYASNGESLKKTMVELRREYNRFRREYMDTGEEAVEEAGDEADESEDTLSEASDVKPLMPSSGKAIAVVDSMAYDEYLKDELEEDSGVTVVRRRMPITVRPISLTLSPEVFIYYDWMRSMGYKKSISEFINDVVKLFFRERGIGVGVVVIENE